MSNVKRPKFNNVILGGGVSGIVVGHLLKNFNSICLEKNNYLGGHAHSWTENGFTWDEGPHVQFGPQVAAKEFFGKLGDEINTKIPNIQNFWYGSWIPHPAQVNLRSIPEGKREKYLTSLLSSKADKDALERAESFWSWLVLAYGKDFAVDFSLKYNTKYWAIKPELMSKKWLGPRFHLPSKEEIISGASGDSPQSPHYFNTFSYPKSGGYMKYYEACIADLNYKLNEEILRINLKDRLIFSKDCVYEYKNLINTLPLPEFIKLCDGAPKYITNAANALLCSEMVIVNVEIPYELNQRFDWAYIYDDELLSTRITSYGELSPSNVPKGCSGLQIEVYGSKYRPFKMNEKQIGEKVVKELVDMGLILNAEDVTFHTFFSKYANVIFDREREENLNLIWSWLENFGLKREDDDLDYTSHWDKQNPLGLGSIMMAGRFAQWNYYWTHDCLLRAKYISENCIKYN
jgi:protoporphyrinogen oxidase